MSLHICLSLAKYSHSTGEASQGISWTHLSAADLCVLLKGDESSSLVMQEKIDIASYVNDSTRMQQEAEVRKIEELPILAITKESLLALRYRMPYGQIRRIQIKFHSEEKCQQIVRPLQEQGVTVQVQLPKTARPDTSATRLGSARSDARPLTTDTSSPFFSQAAQPNKVNTLRVPDLEVGSLSRMPSRSHEAHVSSYAMPPPQVFNTQNSTQFGLGLSRASPQHFSHTECSLNRTSLESGSANLETIRRAAADQEARLVGSQYDRSSNASRLPNWTTQQWPTKNSGPSSEPAERPLTSASRTSSTLELPPLPKPRLVQEKLAMNTVTTGLDSVAEQPSSRPSSALPSSMRNRDADNVQHERMPRGSSSQANPTDMRIDARPASTKPRLIEDMGRGGPPLDQTLTSNVSRINSALDAPHDLVSPPATSQATFGMGKSAARSSSINRNPAENDSVKRAFAAIKSSSYNAEAALLDQYAVQSPEDREAALEQFMVENLQNPTFTTLCEDVERCWRRIALGL